MKTDNFSFHKIKLGVSPLSWMNTDIPSLGANISVNHCLSEAALIGYEGVEFEAPFNKVFSQLPRLLAERGLKLISSWHSTFILKNSLEEEKERLKLLLDRLHQCGGNMVTFAECTDAIHQQEQVPLSKRPIIKEEDWNRLADGLDELTLLAKENSFKATYHHHMGTVIQSSHEIDRLMEQTKHLGLLLDTGHLYFADQNIDRVLFKHLKRINHVHFKNVRTQVLLNGLENDHSFIQSVLNGVFTVPGDDGINFYPILKELIKSEYDGWVVVEAEQDPDKADSYRYAQLGHSSLKYLINKVTLKL